MGDDLAAFFAKKAQKKSKKKIAVSLDDVGQQLERKVKIQETGELEYDEEPSKEHVETVLKIQQNNEDSEWIECSEKASVVGIAFKELTDNPEDSYEEEKKGSNTETSKTWNIVDKKEVEEVIPKAPAKYQAPAGRRAMPLDLNNQEMFPSIAHADEIAEKLKTEEKKRALQPAKPEDQFDQVENKKLYRPPVRSEPAKSYDGPRQRVYDNYRSGDRLSTNPINRRSALPNDNSESPSETASNWRGTSRSVVTTPATTFNQNNVNESKSDESDNWRSSKKRAPPTASYMPTPTSTATNSGSPAPQKYVPPHIRNK